MKKTTTAPTLSRTQRPQQRWTPALRFMLAIAQVISVIGVSTINLTQPKFAPLVGDALGPWASPLVRQAAQAVDSFIGAPNVAAAAVTCSFPVPVVNGTFAANPNANWAGVVGSSVNGWAWSGSDMANVHDAGGDTLSQNVAEIAPSSRIDFTTAWGNGGGGNGGNAMRLDVRYNGVTYLSITTPNGPGFGTLATVSAQNGATSNIAGPITNGTNTAFQLTLPAGIPNTGALAFVTTLVGGGDVAGASDDYYLDTVSVVTTRLCVRKQTVGGTGTFNFNTTNIDNSHNTAGTQNTASITTLAAGVFEAADASNTIAGSQAALVVNEAANATIAETVPAGWVATGTCYDAGTLATVGTIVAGAVNIPAALIAIGGSYICDYTNTRNATVTIIKDAVPNSAQDFAFTSGTIGAFSLDDDADPTLPNTLSFSVVPGVFTVVETAVAGWNLTGLTCTDPTGNSIGNTGTGAATINAAAGETIVCTYVNTQNATITIIKDAVPNSAQDFAFTGSAPIGAFSLDDDADPTLPNTRSFSVVPGFYSVVETAVAGWTLTGLTCADPTLNSIVTIATGTALINAATGETIVCTYVNSLPVLTATKSAAPAVVRPGDTVTYTIQVTNTSAVTATGVVVSDSLPAPLVLQTSTASQGSYAAPTWNVGTITPSTSVILTLTALVPSSVASGTAILNTAVVTSPNSVPVTPTVVITPVAPVLTATKSAAPSVVRPSDTVTYTIRVTNTSNVTATNVSVSDSLPSPLVLQTSTASQGSYVAPTWNVGTITPSTSVILTLTALIPSSVASGTAILNTAVVTSPNSVPVTPTVVITPVKPVLIATKTFSPSFVRPGDTVVYTIRVTNTTAITATGLWLRDPLPSAMVFVSAASSIAGQSYVTPTFTPAFTLAPFASAIFTLTVRLP